MFQPRRNFYKTRRKFLKFDFFALWGSNAILTYVVVTFVKLLLAFYAETALASMSVWIAILITLAVLAVFTFVNWLLRYKKVYIRV